MTRKAVESYIVRVYRRDEEVSAKIAGMVEVVQTGEVRTFADREELFEVICAAKEKKRGAERTGLRR